MNEKSHSVMADEILQCLYSSRKEFRETMHDEFQSFRNALSGRTGVYAIFYNNNLEYVGHPDGAPSTLLEHFITEAAPMNAFVETEFVMRRVDRLEIAFVEVSPDVFPQVMKHLKP